MPNNPRAEIAEKTIIRTARMQMFETMLMHVCAHANYVLLMGMLKPITGCAALWIRASSATLFPHPTLYTPMGWGYNRAL